MSRKNARNCVNTMKRHSTVTHWSETFNRITNVELKVCVVTCSRERKQQAAYNFRVTVQENVCCTLLLQYRKIRFMRTK